jgi:hypothetical protein
MLAEVRLMIITMGNKMQSSKRRFNIDKGSRNKQTIQLLIKKWVFIAVL